MGLDDRIGPKFLRAGIGGGGCFGKDTIALKKLAGNTGYHFQLLSAVIDVNELQKRRVVGKLKQHLGPLAGRRIALLGLAFKPDTDDMRDAASLVLAARLQGEGAEVRAYDPIAEQRGASSARRRDQRLARVRAGGRRRGDPGHGMAGVRRARLGGVGATDGEPLLVDGRNFLDPARLRAAGFTYEGIGRRPTAPRRRTPDAGARAGRRRGDAAAAAHPDAAEAGRAAG